MEKEHEQKKPGFITLIAAPAVALLLGTVLLYVTAIPWSFAPAGELSAICWGFAGAAVLYMTLALFTRLPVARSLLDIMRTLRPLFTPLNGFKLLLVALFAGVGEEVLFRAFLQTWLASIVGIEMGIVIAAICFGLMHFASVGYFLLTSLLGALLGYAYHATGSLLLVITWHAVYDLIALWVLARRPQLIGIDPDASSLPDS